MSREPQVGPVCCRPLRAGSRLPAHAVAPGTCVVLLTVLQESLLGPFAFGSCQAALLLQALSCRSRCVDTGVLGAAGRPYLLQTFTRDVLPEEPATGPWELLGGPVAAGPSRLVLLF